MKKIILLVLIGCSLSVNAQNQKKKAMPTKTTSTAVKKPTAVSERKAVVYQVFTRLFGNKKTNNKPWGTIEDNGVGRAKAAELKSKSATIQKSHGLQVTAARIDLINQLYNTQNKVFITDLYDKNGAASGTRVELSLE